METKKIGNAQITFNRRFTEEGQGIDLIISVPESLRDVLKRQRVEGSDISFQVYLGYDDNSARKYKNLVRKPIKRVVFGALTNNTREVLFCEELLNNGSVSFTFENIAVLEQTIDEFKNNFKRFYQIVNENDNVVQTVTYVVKD